MPRRSIINGHRINDTTINMAANTAGKCSFISLGVREFVDIVG